MSINWVMIPDDLSKPFTPLPRERILFSSPARTAFSLKTPKPPAGSAPTDASSSSSSPPVGISIANGVAYVTTQRLIYLPRPATATFKSFSVPLLNLQDSHVTAPFFGPNVLVGDVKPVRDGGIPPVLHAPYLVEMKLTFKEGGAYDFHTKFCELRERAIQAREIVREIGENGSHQEVHGEQLPAYEESGRGGGVGAAATGAAVAAPPAQIRTTRAGDDDDAEPPPFSSISSSSRPGHNSGPPDEPPPDYEEIVKS